MSDLPISVCMISGAESRRIARALESVSGWTREIIVVLNNDVQDGTEQIAMDRGAKVFREPWKGHIAQKNSAASKASQPWILGLDSDEAVSPELKGQIEQALAAEQRQETHAAYSFPRLTFFCGRWIRHGDWYPDRSIRLWRKGRAEWGGVDPHDKLKVNGTIGQLHGDLLHYNAESLNKQIAKVSAFSDDFVKDALARGRKASWFDLAFRPVWRFLRSYFFRFGFLDGWQGWHIAWMTAFYTVTRYAKVREAQLPAGLAAPAADPHSKTYPASVP
ncbi:MAG TPA: glycosyltransferase family 2 protein [Verrucomicrobiae bacterium]|nr:glycosyltransferase family 2 protein [Verrucomicrobiae bacterium]